VTFALLYVPTTGSNGFQRDSTPDNISIITKGYWIAETVVTQKLWAAIMTASSNISAPSSFDGNTGNEPHDTETQDQRPVETITWYDAVEFCNLLSEADGKDKVYDITVNSRDGGGTGSIDDATVTADFTKNGYRLPTEMEWMWAAMGATDAATGYSKAFAGSTGSNAIGAYAWYTTNSTSKTHEVGKKTANELGIKDMSGNVWEWCWDWYDDYPTVTKSDYAGADSGSARVMRGGSWSNPATRCSVAFRGDGDSDNQSSTLGFRVVRQ
jgi:formylglycine-generating enzyme required for sulfatase activity